MIQIDETTVKKSRGQYYRTEFIYLRKVCKANCAFTTQQIHCMINPYFIGKSVRIRLFPIIISCSYVMLSSMHAAYLSSGPFFLDLSVGSNGLVSPQSSSLLAMLSTSVPLNDRKSVESRLLSACFFCRRENQIVSSFCQVVAGTKV